MVPWKAHRKVVGLELNVELGEEICLVGKWEEGIPI